MLPWQIQAARFPINFGGGKIIKNNLSQPLNEKNRQKNCLFFSFSPVRRLIQ